MARPYWCRERFGPRDRKQGLQVFLFFDPFHQQNTETTATVSPSTVVSAIYILFASAALIFVAVSTSRNRQQRQSSGRVVCCCDIVSLAHFSFKTAHIELDDMDSEGHGRARSAMPENTGNASSKMEILVVLLAVSVIVGEKPRQPIRGFFANTFFFFRHMCCRNHIKHWKISNRQWDPHPVCESCSCKPPRKSTASVEGHLPRLARRRLCVDASPTLRTTPRCLFHFRVQAQL